jgi:hypothetical protein
LAIVVEFVKDYAPWIYGACALVALWYLRVAVLARRERRHAMFAMEQEAALNRTYGAWSVAFALIIVMGIIYFLSTVVSDAVQPLVLGDRTPTPSALTRVLASPTLPLPETTPSAEAATQAPATPRPRPTAKPQPTTAPLPTATVAAPVVASPRCSDPNAVISAPGLNSEVSGMVPILGTAANQQMKYYKLEFGVGATPAVWSYFAGGEHSVENGRLGTLNAGALAPGTYSVRVVVVDATGNYPPPCQTTIVVK